MALLFLEDQDDTFSPNLFSEALVSLKLLFLSPPAGHSKNIISRGLILVLLSIIWRIKKKSEDSFWSGNCVWLFQRERQKEGGWEKGRPPLVRCLLNLISITSEWRIQTAFPHRLTLRQRHFGPWGLHAERVLRNTDTNTQLWLLTLGQVPFLELPTDYFT